MQVQKGWQQGLQVLLQRTVSGGVSVLRNIYRRPGSGAVSRNWLGATAAIGLAFLSSGCISTRSYVDTALPKVSIEEVKAPTSPKPVQLLFEFQTNGNSNAAITAKLKPRAEKIIRDSKLFSEVSSTGTGGDQRLYVTLNNKPEEGAGAKGFKTGLTFGLVGTMVTDFYEMVGVYETGKETRFKEQYKHALHSTVGNAKGPEGVPETTSELGFDQIFEQLLLHFLRDLSKSDLL